MSLTKAIKRKILSHLSDESKNNENERTMSFRKEEEHDEADSNTWSVDDEDTIADVSSVASGMVSNVGSPMDAEDDSSDMSVYEVQLTQLQEQLVEAMIDNESLKDELKEYKEKNKVDKLLLELKHERERSKKVLTDLRKLQAKSVEEGWVDVAKEVTEQEKPEGTASTKDSWRQKFLEWALRKFYDTVEDFTCEDESNLSEEVVEEKFSVKQLKANVKRFRSNSQPVWSTLTGIRDLFSWKSPAITLIVLMGYLFALWHGYLLPMILFLLVFRLFINYLRYRGVNIEIHYFRNVESEKEPEDKDLGMADKMNIVLEVAKRVQNTLGKLADNMEKIKNLLTWQQPEATQRVFMGLCMAFLASVFLSGRLLCLLVGIQLAVKLFVTDFIYNRFPRVRKKYDTMYKLWRNLPTDAEIGSKEARAKHERKRLSSPSRSALELSGSFEDDSYLISKQNRAFLERHSLPTSEVPLPGWKGGRICTEIDKSKGLKSAFKRGKLFLTHSFLIFEHSKNSEENLQIPLADITAVVKAKPYSWMPGSGMAIEVFMSKTDKPYLFGGIIHRDEAYQSIICQGQAVKLPWAPPPIKKRSASGTSQDGLTLRMSALQNKDSN